MLDFIEVATDLEAWLTRSGLGGSAHAQLLADVKSGTMDDEQMLTALEDTYEWLVRCGLSTSGHGLHLAQVIAEAKLTMLAA